MRERERADVFLSHGPFRTEMIVSYLVEKTWPYISEPSVAPLGINYLLSKGLWPLNDLCGHVSS